MDFPRPELLLHPLIPPPLHGMAPRTIKGQKWWDKERELASARNCFCCWACNIPQDKARHKKGLEGHESYEIDWQRGTCCLQEVVSLCHFCHNYIHQGRLRALLANGSITRVFYEDVLRHGNNLTAHLVKPAEPAQMAAWAEWVMIVNGTPYPARFRTSDEWTAYYEWLNAVRRRDSTTSLKQFREFYVK